MNLMICQFFMTLSIVRSDIPSIEIINNEYETFIQNLVLKHGNGSNFTGVFHDNRGIREKNLPEFLESRYHPIIVHDLMTEEVLYSSSDILVRKIVGRKTERNIIIIEDSKTFRSMLQVLESIPFFDASTMTLVILTGKVPGTEEWIRRIFSQLWEIYILNVGLVFHTDKINLYTYIPWTSPHELKDLSDQGISANIFFNKLKDMRKYPVKILEPVGSINLITTHADNDTKYKGIDGMTMNLFLERVNATSKMIKFIPSILSPCRFVHYNFTIQGLFGADENNESIGLCSFSLRHPKKWEYTSSLEIIRHNADMTFESKPLRSSIDYRVVAGTLQQLDGYCLLIPANKRILEAFNFILPFEPAMWIAILMNFVTHVAIYFGMQTLTETNKKNFLHTCFMLYRIQLGNAIPDSQELRARGRAYLLGWILYSFVVCASYQSVIMSVLTVPAFEPPINRIEELRGVDFPIYVSADTLDGIHEALDSEAGEILLPKLVLDLWTNERKYDPKNGYMVERSTANYLLQRRDLLDENGRPFFHLMKECPIPTSTGYQMRRGLPFRHSVNKITYLKTEHGFAQKWHQQAIDYMNKQIPPRNITSKEGRLTIRQLQGAFYILIIGSALGLCAFLLEFYRK